MAEKTFPGIGRFYRGLSDKPATFLQLVWLFEAQQARRGPSARPLNRRRG
jgi:hypothetical protein